MASAGHKWKFFRAGGVDQVVLAGAADLVNLHELDQKLWVALSCPVVGLEFDARTLALLDADGDGRIRPPDILAAIAWLAEVLVDLGDLFEPSDEVPLESISDDSEAGRNVLAGARLILKNLGKASAEKITLADVSDTEKIFTATKLNGDGIVPPDSADDPETSAVIADVITVMDSTPDRSGKPGVNQAKVDAFFDQARLFADWSDAGGSLLALGEATGAAVAALDAVRAKVDDYFSRCRLASFDARAATALNPTEPELAALSKLVLTAQSEAVARLPLARIEAARALPLGDGVNPAWAARISDLARATVAPCLGGPRTSITERDWDAITAKLATYEAWLSARPATDVARLGHERVIALARSDARARLTELIARDGALATESNQIESIEKVIRCRRDLVALLENFVNFRAFYGRRKGIFQVGRLYLDARSCDLCLSVHDAARHGMLASLSQAYLVYCDCVRRGDTEKRTIVAAVTAGDTDNIMVGRNGVFYDRKGDDWDATITKITENPISIRQAFFSPYKRALRFVSDRIKDENDLPIWSAHFDFEVENPYGRFWSVIIPLVWWRYYSQPRTTSFGLEDYDRFSKATTCFLAPRSMLLEAKTEFSSFYADTRDASDDTGLIRLLAARQQINVSPHFSCTYVAHEGYRAFMHNVFHRGKTFVDSYGRPGTRFFPLVVAYYPISLLAAVIALRRPRLALKAAAATPVGFAAVATALRRDRADILAVTWIGPNWLAAMCLGLWYGLGLALRARFGRGENQQRHTPAE